MTNPLDVLDVQARRIIMKRVSETFHANSQPDLKFKRADYQGGWRELTVTARLPSFTPKSSILTFDPDTLFEDLEVYCQLAVDNLHALYRKDLKSVRH